jgi:hypothetical protein
MLWWRANLHMRKGTLSSNDDHLFIYIPNFGTEQYNQVSLYSTHSRPPGSQGQQGFGGFPPAAYLGAGAEGPQGSVQIKVKSSNGMDSVYPGKYHIKVVSFEVVDENGDAIMEPGEHIMVRNICVQNLGMAHKSVARNKGEALTVQAGLMPTPAHARIPILINASGWFDPISNDPAYLPTSIFPGETVSVRGEVRAFIRQEGILRHPGVIFSATEELQLTAVMPGINRVLPDFFQPIPINIRYPLELETPITLRSVERGSDITFTWRVQALSPQGLG